MHCGIVFNMRYTYLHTYGLTLYAVRCVSVNILLCSALICVDRLSSQILVIAYLHLVLKSVRLLVIVQKDPAPGQ